MVRMRAVGALPDDPLLHVCVAAYAERHVAARLRAARAAPGMGRGHGDRREPRARHLVSRAGPSRRLAPTCQRRTCDVRRARLARG